MHFLIRLALRNLPAKQRVLCIGVGTGAEILSLANAFPEWTFVGVDPSDAMLEVCRERLEAAGLMNRCELLQVYVHDVTAGENFDIAVSVLVAHFVKKAERADFFWQMANRLRTGGTLVNAETSYDLDAKEFAEMLTNWEGVQTLLGATPESLAKLPTMLRDPLAVLPPEETEHVLRDVGFTAVVRFFQAFMICGWHARKV